MSDALHVKTIRNDEMDIADSETFSNEAEKANCTRRVCP